MKESDSGGSKFLEFQFLIGKVKIVRESSAASANASVSIPYR